MTMMTDEMKRYYEKKIKCPNCGSENLVETFIHQFENPPVPFKDVYNRTTCKVCYWNGCVDELRG